MSTTKFQSTHLKLRLALLSTCLSAQLIHSRIVSADDSLLVGVTMRSGLSLLVDDKGEDHQLTVDSGLGEIAIIPYFVGSLTDYAGFQAVLLAGVSSINIVDAFVTLKLADAFQIRMGQHIPATDRNHLVGPLCTSGWLFPKTFQTFPTDFGGRDRGLTFWGVLINQRIKYYLSVMDLQNNRKIENVRFGGRLVLNLLDPVASYVPLGTYFGAKDVLSVGVTGQYQKGVETVDNLDNDYIGFSADLFFEKKLEGMGAITFEGLYFNSEETGLDYVVNQGTLSENIGFTPGAGSSYMFGLAWLFASKIGPGQLQPAARIQYQDLRNSESVTSYDFALGYIIDGNKHKYFVNYHRDEGAVESNIVQIGVQIGVGKAI